MDTNSSLAQKNERSGRNVCAECGAELPLDDVKADLLNGCRAALVYLQEYGTKGPDYLALFRQLTGTVARAEGREVAP